jgi:hypothetical protein
VRATVRRFPQRAAGVRICTLAPGFATPEAVLGPRIWPSGTGAEDESPGDRSHHRGPDGLPFAREGAEDESPGDHSHYRGPDGLPLAREGAEDESLDGHSHGRQPHLLALELQKR